MDKDNLLEQLTILDFMAIDLDLYLNTHPDDAEAIEQYNSVIMDADRVRSAYEKAYGPLCSYRSSSNPRQWRWIDDPWPWSAAGNFCLGREERF